MMTQELIEFEEKLQHQWIQGRGGRAVMTSDEITATVQSTLDALKAGSNAEAVEFYIRSLLMTDAVTRIIYRYLVLIDQQASICSFRFLIC